MSRIPGTVHSLALFPVKGRYDYSGSAVGLSQSFGVMFVRVCVCVRVRESVSGDSRLVRVEQEAREEAVVFAAGVGPVPADKI